MVRAHKSEASARERGREHTGGGFPAVSGGMPGGMTWGSEVLGVGGEAG